MYKGVQIKRHHSSAFHAPSSRMRITSSLSPLICCAKLLYVPLRKGKFSSCSLFSVFQHRHALVSQLIERNVQHVVNRTLRRRVPATSVCNCTSFSATLSTCDRAANPTPFPCSRRPRRGGAGPWNQWRRLCTRGERACVSVLAREGMKKCQKMKI